MRYIRHIIILGCVLAVLTPGCKKAVLDCDYVVTPYLVPVDGVDNHVMKTVIGYAFYADTANWAVDSYDDALNGIIANRNDNTSREYDIMGNRDSAGKLHFRVAGSKLAIFVVCDPQNKLYAWRQIEIAENLERVSIQVKFKPWIDTLYQDAKWLMVNEFPSVKPEPEKPDTEPEVPETETE